MTTTENTTLARIEQLERQEELLSAAVRFILEGRLSGEMPNASAQLVALMGGEENAAAANFRPRLDARFKQLEDQRQHLVDAVRYVVEGRWTGPMPHASAEIVAL